VLRVSNNVEEKDEEEKIRTDNEIRCVRAPFRLRCFEPARVQQGWNPIKSAYDRRPPDGRLN